MTSFINNTNALIWAFDETIDEDTAFDGNDAHISIRQTNDIIKHLISKNCFDSNITKDILVEYMDILANISINIPSKSSSKSNEYLLCGWKSHCILLFWEKQPDESYDFGMINCGQGCDIQGKNNILCNGLIIFKKITKTNIDNFLETYQKYFNKTERFTDFKENKLYAIFYFILFDKLLEYKDHVKFNEMDTSKVQKYIMRNQYIGSCTFTNLINCIYYIYVKKQSFPSDQHYANYLDWYNTAKKEIKKKLFNDIVTTKDTTMVNMYKYILDTTDMVSDEEESDSLDKSIHAYESLFTNVKINSNRIQYKSPEELYIHQISKKVIDDLFYYTPNKILILNALWDLYYNHNLTLFISLLNSSPGEYLKLIDNLVIFYRDCKLFDNDNRLIIPLLILYKLKKENSLSQNIFTELLLEPLFNKYIIKFDNEHFLINLFIYLLLIKESIKNEEKYYSNSHLPTVKTKFNIIFYNYILFKNIPIINNYYGKIVDDLVKDLNDNIEIFPDITEKDACKYDLFNYISYLIRMNSIMDDKIVVKYLYKYNLDRNNTDEYFHTGIYFSKNFLLWYILINYIYEELPEFILTVNGPPKLHYETYGYYNKEIYDTQKEKNFIKDADDGYHIIGYPGGYKTTDQKILLFKNAIYKKLKEKLSSQTFVLGEESSSFMETLKEYLTYFYLCELSGDKLETTDEIFKTYNPHIYKYFNEVFDIHYFKPLIYTYILKYNQIYYIPEKHRIMINLDTISNVEKHLFLLPIYEYTIGENELCQSVINFYKIKYNNKYTLFFYENKQNTPTSINIIKTLLKSSNFIYLALNFYYQTKHFFDGTGNNIIGTNKNDPNITIEYQENDIANIYYIEKSIKYKIVEFTQLPDKYHNFYNLMTHNDFSIFTYKNDKTNEYFLRTLNYDFVFKMYEDKIFYFINNIEYQVHFCNDIDIYYNYSILKLSPKDSTGSSSDKLLCIYNHNHILDHPDLYIIQTKKRNNFINRDFIKNKYNFYPDIPPEFRKYYYKIINKFNDKYIFNNIYDVLALLINCLNYNSPYLILKNIEQIKNILNNNKTENFYTLLNTLFIRFDNIYSISILLLFYNKKLNEYYYSHANNLYTKYQILLKLNYTEEKLEEFNYKNLSTNLSIHLIDRAYDNLIYFQYTEPKIYYKGTSKQYSDTYIYNYSYDTPVEKYNKTYSYDIIIKNTQFILSQTYLLEIKYLDEVVKDKDYQSLFKALLQIFIPELDNKIFDNNIIKATELFNYLIKTDKTELYPIQELIMGSGKTTSITPYICILLLKHFLKDEIRDYNYENEIYIVMPEFLINSSFEILMKYVFSLFNNIEILIYPVKPNYANSFFVYLISDTDYKIMFLEEKIHTETKYMIYDEIDMMANPLTCELNKPFNKLILESTDELYTLSKMLYNDIFINKDFWTSLGKNYESNKIHNYIYNLDADIIKFINTYYDNKIDIYFNSTEKTRLNNLIKYIQDNVLLFILTKQFNFDYGMPETYSSTVSYNYKYKAIPYSAVDNPVMGSEFSDFILTYILTFFCYKIVNLNYRKIDKDYIIDYYESLYIQHGGPVRKLFSFLLNSPTSYKEYLANRYHYINNYKKEFNLDPLDFEIIIKQILKINISYYSNCKNISFNDLLLYKNVKNFVCFTGTAYIEPPVSYKTAINFNPNSYITFGEIDQYKNVLEAIISIINDSNRVCNFYNNTSDMLIEDIFECLNKYEVLIDIGGIFIKYNINSFIEEYKKLKERKEYIVYFDNGRKIYNLNINQFANDDSIIPEKANAFYFFSNKNITGVDAKNIMNKNARGLITITNKTTMRDFSQGIFRMRYILKTQKCDIIFNKKFTDIILKGGCDNFTEITLSNIRENIIKNLIAQQEIISAQKKKVLIKQNIFALNKKSTDASTNEQILYLDPMAESYNTSVEIFDKYHKQLEKGHTQIENGHKQFDIESLNIINIHNMRSKEAHRFTEKKLNKNRFLEDLITKYFTYQNIVIESKQNIIDEHELGKVQVKDPSKITTEATNQMINVPFNVSDNSTGIIYYDFKYKDRNTDQILVAYDCDSYPFDSLTSINKYLDILLIYDNTNNNLVIININNVTNFLMYNENINERYTFIPFYNKSIYGKEISYNLVKHLIKISLSVLQLILSKLKNSDKKISLSKLIQYLHSINYDESFTFEKKIELTFLKLFPVEENNNRKKELGLLLSAALPDSISSIPDLGSKEPTLEGSLSTKYIKISPVYSHDKTKKTDPFYTKYIKYKTKYINIKYNTKYLHS